MEINETSISGCYEIVPKILEDARGSFVKVFNNDMYQTYGLGIDLKEEYYSISHRGVIRGLHFQTPPKDHIKVVYCVFGKVQDVIVDLRVGSPSYGRAIQFELSATKGNILYIPRGIAHGFCVTSNLAILIYKTSSVHAPDHDTGVLYSSIDIDWKCKYPSISARDLSFPALSEFKSPFVYEEQR